MNTDQQAHLATALLVKNDKQQEDHVSIFHFNNNQNQI
jgi:hypothetical protein